jgi:hypothetical protein
MAVGGTPYSWILTSLLSGDARDGTQGRNAPSHPDTSRQQLVLQAVTTGARLRL